MALTDKQLLLHNVLKKNCDWLTVAEIAELTKLDRPTVRDILKSRVFDSVQKGKREEVSHGQIRHISLYRYPFKANDATEQALMLAKMHTGIFGQLFWTNDLYEQPKRLQEFNACA